MEFMGNLADLSNKTWSGLEESGKGQAFKNTMAQYGITQREWNEGVLKADLTREDGVDFLKPDDVFSSDSLNNTQARELGLKIHEAILSEQARAVPTTTLASQTSLEGGDRGSIMKQLTKLGTQFLSFPVSMHQLHITRGMKRSGGFANKMNYLGGTVLGSTLLAGLVVQMEEVIEGRDPIDLTESGKDFGKFWLKAMSRGGGLGILGDVLIGHPARDNIGDAFKGPAVQFLADSQKLIGKGVGEVTSNEDQNFGLEFTEYLKDYMPGGNIWYAETAIERFLFDQMQQWVDPEANAEFRKEMRFFEQKQGNDYWWERGEVTPDRAPTVN